MHPEHSHQIHGGEISDYFAHKAAKFDENNIFHDQAANELESIYQNQVKSKGKINTDGIININNISVSNLIERQPDKFQRNLNDLLSKVAQQVGLEGTDTPVTQVNIQPREQTSADINAANDAVARAMAELKDLGAI